VGKKVTTGCDRSDLALKQVGHLGGDSVGASLFGTGQTTDQEETKEGKSREKGVKESFLGLTGRILLKKDNIGWGRRAGAEKGGGRPATGKTNVEEGNTEKTTSHMRCGKSSRANGESMVLQWNEKELTAKKGGL